MASIHAHSDESFSDSTDEPRNQGCGTATIVLITTSVVAVVAGLVVLIVCLALPKDDKGTGQAPGGPGAGGSAAPGGPGAEPAAEPGTAGAEPSVRVAQACQEAAATYSGGASRSEFIEKSSAQGWSCVALEAKDAQVHQSLLRFFCSASLRSLLFSSANTHVPQQHPKYLNTVRRSPPSARQVS